MEGRAIARPNPLPEPGDAPTVLALQWRAGQLPGQTTAQHAIASCRIQPSMEGRAIARPNVSIRGGDGLIQKPSMEGRAIARPNRSLDSTLLKCRFAGLCERCRKRELRR